MSDYDFILDNVVFSFSSVSSFNTCPHGFFLTYINGENREDNFFSDYGKFVHGILELYFGNKLGKEELAGYYKDNYELEVRFPCPPYPAGMAQNYYDEGYEFFEDFSFDKSKYDVIIIEDTINSDHRKINLVVKPDLVLREKETGKYFLIDYKTSRYKKSKKEDKKMLGYKKQFYLYSYFLWKEKQIEISQIKIWFIRDQIEHVIEIDHNEVMNTLEWFENTVKNIKKENEWNANTSLENKYFCSWLCSVRSKCEFIKKIEG